MGKPVCHLPQFPSLLLVQRHPAAAKALRRLLGQYYGEVLLATDPEKAEQLLAAEGRGPTHLVCGQDFGPASQSGQECVGRWRQRFPDIERAVLATGVEGLPEDLPGVDGVYQKPEPLSLLFSLLGVRTAQLTDATPVRKQPPTYSIGVHHESNQVPQVPRQEHSQGTSERVYQGEQAVQ